MDDLGGNTHYFRKHPHIPLLFPIMEVESETLEYKFLLQMEPFSSIFRSWHDLPLRLCVFVFRSAMYTLHFAMEAAGKQKGKFDKSLVEMGLNQATNLRYSSGKWDFN